jgi:ribosomal protein L12E/L44/L45/RPP1/RPP2
MEEKGRDGRGSEVMLMVAMGSVGYREVIDQNLGQFTTKQIDEAIRKVKEQLAARAPAKRAETQAKKRRHGAKR